MAHTSAPGMLWSRLMYNLRGCHAILQCLWWQSQSESALFPPALSCQHQYCSLALFYCPDHLVGHALKNKTAKMLFSSMLGFFPLFQFPVSPDKWCKWDGRRGQQQQEKGMNVTEAGDRQLLGLLHRKGSKYVLVSEAKDCCIDSWQKRRKQCPSLPCWHEVWPCTFETKHCKD